jgi:hypothetical protein
MTVKPLAVRLALSVGTGFLCPNNHLNMYAFMHEYLPKHAHKSSYKI